MMQKQSNILLCGVLILLSMLATSCTTFHQEKNTCEDCHVVIIIVDTLRADHLGVFGYEKNTSPNIDAFAKQAKAYNNAMSQSGSTLFSIPSILTSKYPFTDNILEEISSEEIIQSMNITINKNKLDYVTILREEAKTLPELLKEEGYTTIGVTAMGFASSYFGIAQGFDMYDEDMHSGEEAKETFTKMQKYLLQINPQKEKLFLWTHIRPPHTPYNVSKELFLQFYTPHNGEPTYDGVLTKEKQKELLAYFNTTEQVTSLEDITYLNVTSSILKQMQALYDASIYEMDADVQEFLIFLENYLGKEELYNNTIIIIAADHGESLGTKNWYTHNRVFYEIVHTPILLYYPGVQPEINNEPVMNVDIMPTILSLLKIDYSTEDLRGESILLPKENNRMQFAETPYEYTIKIEDIMFLMNYDDNYVYNISSDPQELYDLKKERPELLYLLKESLNVLSKKTTTYEEVTSLNYI